MLALLTISHISNFFCSLSRIRVLIYDTFIHDILSAFLFWVSDTVRVVINILIRVSIFGMIRSLRWKTTTFILSIKGVRINRSFTPLTVCVSYFLDSTRAITSRIDWAINNLLHFWLDVWVFSIFWSIIRMNWCDFIICSVCSEGWFLGIFCWMLITWRVSMSNTIILVLMGMYRRIVLVAWFDAKLWWGNWILWVMNEAV